MIADIPETNMASVLPATLIALRLTQDVRVVNRESGVPKLMFQRRHG
jgi:hypothetical protein